MVQARCYRFGLRVRWAAKEKASVQIWALAMRHNVSSIGVRAIDR